MNTQYRKNLKAVLEASKIYCDESIDSLKWELGTYDLSVDSDTTSAYQKNVPANSIEAKINTLGGMSYKSENLISLADVAETTTNGITYKVQNNVITLSGTCSSQLTLSFNLLNGTISNVNYYANFGTAQYQSGGFASVQLFNDTTQIDYIDLNTSSKALSDITMNILKIVINTDTIITSGTIKPMLIKGTTAPTEYQPYFDGIRDTAITSVKSVGANLFDNTNTSLVYSTFNASNQTLFSYGGFALKVFNLTIGQTYTITSTKTMLLGETNDLTNSGTVSNGTSYTFTATTTYLLVTNYAPNEYEEIFENLMINYGSTALPYKPYFTASLLIPAYVQALDGYGWGINDTCYNYIDFNAKKFIKKVGRVDLGNINWEYYNYAGDSHLSMRSYGIADYVKKASSSGTVSNLLCKFESTSGDNVWNETIDGSIAIGTDGVIQIYSSTMGTDATAFKTAMSGVYLYYELATPVETDISAYLTTNKITVEGGGTLTMENTYGASVPSDIDYLKEVAK